MTRRSLKLAALLALLALPPAAAEGLARWWMRVGAEPPGAERLEWRAPRADAGWTALPDEFREVKPQLHCSGGSMGRLDLAAGRAIHVSFITWDAADRVAPTHALSHLPEQCMGAVGLRLVELHPPREHPLAGGGRIVFDSTEFASPAGGGRIFVFKGLWLHGLDGVNLRDGVFGGNFESLRSYRLGSARHRFRPARSRVLMGTVHGAPDEETAWRWFEAEILPGARLASAD